MEWCLCWLDYKFIKPITDLFFTDESWDITTPLSHESGSGGLDDHNNNQTLDDTEFAEPQIKKSEQRTDNQDQNLNDVHDFFDSWQ